MIYEEICTKFVKNHRKEKWEVNMIEFVLYIMLYLSLLLTKVGGYKLWERKLMLFKLISN